VSEEYAVDLEKVREFLDRKRESRSSRLKVKWEEAQRDFERIVEHIRLRYKPRRIYQWGSLLDLSRFSEISDIDIALEGIDRPEEYFAILGDAMKLTDFPLDIVEMNKLDPETAEGIRKKGRLVYESGK
jgi:predicted nucleotidyltransferase